MKNRLQRFLKFAASSLTLQLIAVVGVTSVMGGYFLMSSRAATATIALPAESGVLSGPVTVVADANVGGGKKIVFGAPAAAPTVAITSPAAGAIVQKSTVIAVNANAAVGIAKVDILIDGALKTTQTVAPYGYSWDIANVANGQHTISAKVTDRTGQVVSRSITVTVSKTTTSISIDTANLYKPSATIACASGTRDLGVHTGYANGSPLSIRLCALPNMRSSSSESTVGSKYYVAGANGNAIVNSRVSGAYYAMINAAKASGIQMYANSSFRTMAHQQALWNANPNPTYVARPGYSNHQSALAIDFGTSSGSSIRRGDQWFTWLSQNAAKYGIKNYAPENWHWSPFGT